MYPPSEKQLKYYKDRNQLPPQLGCFILLLIVVAISAIINYFFPFMPK